MSWRDRPEATWSRGELHDAYQDMTTRANTLASENVALRQRMAKLEDVARRTAAFDDSASLECGHCFAGSPDRIEHADDCPVTLARALLAEPPIRPRLDYGAPDRDDDPTSA